MRIGALLLALIMLSTVLEIWARAQATEPYTFLREREPVSAEIRVIDPGNSEDCITVTVTAESGTPKEEAASLRDKINAAYEEFGRWEE